MVAPSSFRFCQNPMASAPSGNMKFEEERAADAAAGLKIPPSNSNSERSSLVKFTLVIVPQLLVYLIYNIILFEMGRCL